MKTVQKEQISWVDDVTGEVITVEWNEEEDRGFYRNPEEKAWTEAEAEREVQAVETFFKALLGKRYDNLPDWAIEALIDAGSEDMRLLENIRAWIKEL